MSQAIDFANIGLAFAEGIGLVLSPCILPILPIVLSSSVDGGLRRPFGVIIGFVGSFSLFALVLRQGLSLLGVDPGLLRTASLYLLLVFGFVLLIPYLSEQFNKLTQNLARLGQNAAGQAQKTDDDLLGGIALGSMIGLIWTPCAGPILAAVLVQSITQQNDLSSALTLIAFSCGAGSLMLIISLTGRSLLQKVSFLQEHAELVKRLFGVLIVASVVLSLFAPSLLAQIIGGAANTSMSTTEIEKDDHSFKPYAAPAIEGIEHWFNSPPLQIADLRGKVVLIDFWTYSCVNCVRTLPHLRQWHDKYADQGLVIIGVHAPEFDFEKNPENVNAAIINQNLKYPIALDNQFKTWRNFKNQFWPAHYLIDKNGQVVYTHFGEGNALLTENRIRGLLGLEALTDQTDQTAKNDKIQKTKENISPEIYLGSARADESQVPWKLSGKWRTEAEYIESSASGDILRLPFRARQVLMVIGGKNNDQKQIIKIKFNGKPLTKNIAGKDIDSTNSTLTVEGERLYELLALPDMQEGLLEIEVQNAGLRAYTFTFGD